MGADRRALPLFFLVACIPPWIGWSLITFGAVPQGARYAPLLYITSWGSGSSSRASAFCFIARSSDPAPGATEFDAGYPASGQNPLIMKFHH